MSSSGPGASELNPSRKSLGEGSVPPNLRIRLCRWEYPELAGGQRRTCDEKDEDESGGCVLVSGRP
jgi:hypothetical protein